MEAGLHRFGTDFGNGASDARFFQVDEERERYLAARAAVPPHRRDRVRVCDERDRAAHDAVRRWMRERIGLELPGVLPDPGTEDAGSFYAAVAALVQEDFVVIRRDAEDATEAAIAVVVSFPSGWRPERILGASFREIHGPVPGFADDPVQTRAMAASMIERGPYVRFVWTITADDHLDHHADEGRREPWSEASRGWLRVERQVTVPFPAPEASLFLIRTYLYAFDDLRPGSGRPSPAPCARCPLPWPDTRDSTHAR